MVPKLARLIYLTLVYAACEASVRRDLWVSLHHIFLSMDDPWLVGDDFSVITHDDECTSHGRRYHGSIFFLDMMLDFGLEDVGSSRSQYTLTNGQVSKRLDGVLINATAANFC